MSSSKFLTDIYFCFLASFLALFIIPFYMIGDSPQDYKFTNFPVLVISGLCYSFTLGLILSLICFVFRLLKQIDVSGKIPKLSPDLSYSKGNFSVLREKHSKLQLDSTNGTNHRLETI